MADVIPVKLTSGQFESFQTGDTLPILNGGTGGTTVAQAKTNLSLNLVENTALSTWAGTANLTTLGTITTGSWNATTIAANKGGTGVANNAANTLTFSGNFGLTLTLSNTTSLTLPTSGTLAVIGSDNAFSVSQTFAQGLSLASGKTLDWNSDTYAIRRAAATFQFGAADAAAPVAQTLAFQGARGGTDTNTAAVTTTIQGSLGTGTGAAGDLVFKIGTAQNTGTTIHAATTALTIHNAGTGGTSAITASLVGYYYATGTTNVASYGFIGDTGTGMAQRTAGALSLMAAGGEMFRVDSNDVNYLQSGTLGSNNGGKLGLGAGGTYDVWWSRRAAASISLGGADGASPIAQTLGFQGAHAAVDSNVAAVTSTIQGSLGTGTGTVGDLVFSTGTVAVAGTTQHAATARLTLNSSAATFSVPVVLTPAAAPGSPTDGMIWYDTGLGKFRKREGGSTTDLDTTGAGSTTTGSADIDFGAWPGANETSIAVTGQTGIGAGSKITVSMTAVATSNNTIDDAKYAAALIGLSVGTIVNGTGFTIYARSIHKMQGIFTVTWTWT